MMIRNDFMTQFTGPQIDLAISIALGLNPGENGWIKILSTEENPIDLDTLKNPGNFTMNFAINGSQLMENTKPINLSILFINEELFQYSLVWDRIEYRKYNDDNEEWDTWTSAKSSSYIYQQNQPPESPENQALWINTETYVLYVWDGNVWVSIESEDVMRKSIYDEDNANMDIYEYIRSLVDVLSTNLNVDGMEEDLNAHIDNDDIHTTFDQKEFWSAKESVESANTKINTALDTSKNYTDSKFDEASGTSDEINDDIESMNTTLTSHLNNTEIHITEEERTKFDNKADGDHTHFNDGRIKIDAIDIVDGVLPLARIPHGALERIYKVATRDDMFLLSIDDIQDGDSVYVIDSEEFYYVVDETKLDNIDGYMLYSTGVASSVMWENIQNKPTTILGYGITDAYTKTQLDSVVNDIEGSLEDYVDDKFEELNDLCVLYDTETIDSGLHRPQSIIYDGMYIAAGYGEFSTGNLSTSTDMINWASQTIPTTVRLNDVIKGNNLYVAIGFSGTIITSTNTTTWTKRTVTGVTGVLYSVIYANSLYVVVGEGGTIATSTNGTSWTKRTSGVTVDLNKIIYANNQYISVGDSGTIITSPDGITWTKRDSGVIRGLYDIIYTDGKYITISYDTILTSSDSIIWIPQSHEFTNVSFLNIVGINGGYMICSESGKLMTYLNTGKWYMKDNYVKEDGYFDYMGIIDDHNVLLSRDGSITNFSVRIDTLPPLMDDLQGRAEVVERKLDEIYYNDNELQVIIDKLPNVKNIVDTLYFDKNYYTLVECNQYGPEDDGIYSWHKILQSSDGLLWDTMIDIYDDDYNGIPYKLGYIGSHLLLFKRNFFGEGGGVGEVYVWVESDGHFEKGFDSPIINTIVNTENQCIALGPWDWSFDIGYASHGIKITLVDNIPTFEFLQTVIIDGDEYLAFIDMIYMDNKYIAVADSAILTSSDAITWTCVSTSLSDNIIFTQITGSTENYLVAGFKDGIKYLYHSVDGLIWNEYVTEDTTRRVEYIDNYTDMIDLLYNDGKYIAIAKIGYGNHFLVTSSNRVDWTIIDIGITDITVNSIIYGHNQYIAVGNDGNDYTGAIITSPDGIIWTKRDSGVTSDLNSIIYINNQYIAVGTSGTIITSPDGTTWTTRDSGLPNEYSSTLYGIIYANNQYIAVGESGNIITSPDGITWTKRTSGVDDILWDIAYGNGIFVITNDYNILTSPDGTTWKINGISNSSRYIGFADGHFITYHSNKVYISNDGKNWLREDIPIHGSARNTSSKIVVIENKPYIIGESEGGKNSAFIIYEPNLFINKHDKIIWSSDRFISYGENHYTGNLIIGTSINTIDWTWAETTILFSPIIGVYSDIEQQSTMIIDISKIIVNIDERENVNLIHQSLNNSLSVYPELQILHSDIREISSNISLISDIVHNIEQYIGGEGQ